MADTSNPRVNQWCGHRDQYYDIGWIDNIAALKAYVLRQLGAPRICVELSDEQLTDLIGDCIRYFWKYYSQGHREDYLAFQLVPGMTHYKICQELEEVVDLNLPNYLGLTDNLLSPVTNALISQFPWGGMTFPGQCWGGSDYGDVLGNWNATLTWLEEAKMDFGRKYQVKYIREEKALSVWPTPKNPDRCLLRVYKREHFMNLIQDPLFRKYLVAKAGWLWSLALRKYSLQLAGGGQLNGDSLAADFKQDIKDIEDRIDLETPYNEIVVG
jgi:hypothetical protein